MTKLKNKYLQIRINEETNKQLKEVAAHYGMSDKSETVRQLIRKTYKRIVKKKVKIS